MDIHFDGVRKRRGAFELGPLDLRVASGEYLVLVGPNGAGKTTLLYLVAGFLSPDAGRLRLDGEDAGPKPPEAREAAFVFAEPMLFPHLTVAENVGFPRRHGSVPGEEIDAALDLLGIRSLAGRRPGQLSTGQSRRAEIARALVSRPRVLLLDEPYASIDVADRGAIASSVRAIAAERGITVLHVSHQEESVALGDAVVRLRGGRIEA